jgi:hypothetical protein
MSQKNDNPEITQTTTPEIEQPNIKEFERSTPHPNHKDTQVKSERVRYENADTIYE